MGSKFSKKVKQRKVIMIGLDGAGKTTIFNRIQGISDAQIRSTVGFNYEEIKWEKVDLQFWDVGGEDKEHRYLWKQFYDDCSAIVFVIDCADQERLEEACDEVKKLFRDIRLHGVPLLVLANKADLVKEKDCFRVAELLKLQSIHSRPWKIQNTSGNTGEGVADAMRWLTTTIQNEERKQKKH